MKRKKRNEELKPDEGKKAVENRKMEIAAVKDEEEKEKRRVEAKRRKEKRRKEKDGDGRFAFTCSFCMFRTFEEKDMEAHLASAAHQEMLEYIQKQTKFDKVIMEFLHESMASKFKKACLRKAQTSKPEAENIAETDMLEGVSSDEHLMKIETVHCSACSVYVRASYNTVQQHLNSSDHAKSKHAYKEQMKRESVLIATSLFNNPLVKGNYEKFAKGENPFEIPEIPETAEEDTEYADEEDGEDAAEAAK